MNKHVKRTKKILSFLILSVMIFSMGISTAYAQAISPSDIGSHWAKNEIESWVGRGFVNGYPDGTFKPENPITRAEYIKLVNRLFAFTENGSVNFKDVKESDWFYPEFAIADKAGYLSGYQGNVEPDGFITRHEVAAIAAKVLGLQEDAAAANDFADAAMIPVLNKGFVGAVVKANIMVGFPDKAFKPTKGITRAEAVVVLNRLENIVKIEAIKEQKVKVDAIATVAIKMLPADSKASIQNSDNKVVQATLTDSTIQLKGLKEGTATITVTGKKDRMLDGIVTFKVVVTAATVSSGGGGGGGGSIPSTPSSDENALTSANPVVGATTLVTGSYKSNVTKIEVSYDDVTVQADRTNGTYSCSITPGLPIGTSITVKGYVGSTLVDTDEVTVVENDAMLTDVKVVGTTATEVSGKYAAGVTKVEVLYGNVTKEATLNDNGTFHWNIYPGLDSGAIVTVKGYAGTRLLDIDTATLGPIVEGSYLSELQAIGKTATSVTGKYLYSVTKVEVLYNGLTKTAVLNNGSFSWSIYPGLAGGTEVTVKAYVGTVLKETKVIVTEGGAVEGPYLSEIKAIGTTATSVTGKYVTGVTKVEVLYNSLTKTAVLNNGSFSWSIYPGLVSGTQVTIKAYVGDDLKDTVPVNVQ